MYIQIITNKTKTEILGRINAIIGICQDYLKKDMKRKTSHLRAYERTIISIERSKWRNALKYWKEEKGIINLAIRRGEYLILRRDERPLLGGRTCFNDWFITKFVEAW